MLVLSRKVGEMIQIGDDIFVTIVAVEGNKVRIGIQAPDNARILRGELIHRADSVLVVDVRPEIPH